MPAYQNLVAWVIASMFTLQPAYEKKHCWWGVPWSDTYADSAETIVQAAIDRPLTGKKGPDVVFTIALLVEWASKESRFRPDAIGDGGHSYGLWQINTGTARQSKEVLLAPPSAAPVALDLFHFSFHACKAHPLEERMAQYAWGRDCEHRLELSRVRMAKARELAATYDKWEAVPNLDRIPIAETR
jgi:hypothetical protein